MYYDIATSKISSCCKEVYYESTMQLGF